MKKFILAAMASGMALAVATPASAGIFIGISVNGGAITQVASDGGTGSANYNATVGGFVYNVGAQGSPLLSQPQLLSQSVNISTGSAAVLDIYITQTDLNSFNSGLLSTFTSNTMVGAGAAIASFFSATNYNPITGSTAAQFLAADSQLQSTTFAGPGTFTGANALNVTGPFSETVRYTLNFTGGAGSNFNGTANLTAVPEPATWGMMILGFGLVGGVMRRRKTSVAFA